MAGVQNAKGPMRKAKDTNTERDRWHKETEEGSPENLTSHTVLALYKDKPHNAIQENGRNFLLRII